MWALDSITRCASAALRSGNVAWTIGFTAPDSSSGHTCCRSSAAMAPLSATGRARSVEPVIVSRRCMIVWMFSSAFTPCSVAISTSRPSTASASMLRAK